jgi:hypothetical protein
MAGLAVGRRATLPLSWVAPAEVIGVPDVEWREGGEVWLHNPAPEMLSVARVIAGRRIGRVSAIAGGKRKRVEFSTDPADRDLERHMLDWVSWPWERIAPSDGYLLVAEYSGAGSRAVHVEPRLPVVASRMRVVVGPVPSKVERTEIPF